MNDLNDVDYSSHWLMFLVFTSTINISYLILKQRSSTLFNNDNNVGQNGRCGWLSNREARIAINLMSVDEKICWK